MSLLQDKLILLDATTQKPKRHFDYRLPVYYGWAKLNKIQKREALTVIFLNDEPGPRIGKDGYDGVTRYMNVVYKRWQTDEEMSDAKLCNRMYTVYSIFMDDKIVKGSLEIALDVNFKSDKNNVSEKERMKIREMLHNNYLAEHRGYKEPYARQLELFDM